MSATDNAPATLACGLAGEVVRTFGEVRLRVFGTSMTPSILPGDLISIQRAQINEISAGEVILFSRDGRLFAHRVIAGAGNSDESFTESVPGKPHLITRGDRLRHNDPRVSSSELLGRVISVERDGRKIDFAARESAWMSPVIRLLRTSDYATYLYVRLAALWGRFVGWTFSPRHGRGRSDNKVGPGEGLLSPEASVTKAHNSWAMNVGAKAPTHKPNDSFVAELPARDADGVVECQA